MKLIAENSMVYEARTQKARGLKALAHYWGVSAFQVLSSPKEMAVFYSGETFARPCPTRPRHGFVDSRIIKNHKELSALWQLALAQDAQAEIILMPYINASLSAILTRHAACVGVGHDGATAGKPGCITLPLSLVHFESRLLAAASIEHEPYLELVKGANNEIHYVQLRDGPTIAGFGDFVPHDVTVKRVLTVASTGDLLTWEAAIESAGRGDIVHHPGGSMLSHFAVHASLHNIPVVFGADAPAIGSTLRATTREQVTHVRGLRIGLAYGLSMQIKRFDHAKLLSIVFLAVHQSAALRQTLHGAVLLGIAAALFARFGATACLGELRHSKRRKFNRVCHRSDIYDEAFADYNATRNKMRDAWKDFFMGEWTSNFGGKAWANCAAHTIKLDRRIKDVIVKSDENTTLELIKQLNVNVNLAHNGGWWLNKFVGRGIMDDHAKGQARAVAVAIFNAYSLIEKALTHEPLTQYNSAKLPRLKIERYVHMVDNGPLAWLCGTNPANSVSGHISLKCGQNKHLAQIMARTCPIVKTFFKECSIKYRKVSMAFMMALELAYPSIYRELTEDFLKASQTVNPFIEE